MAHHDLKLRRDFFDDVRTGRKSFEVRKDDRGYEVGDTVRFQEVVWAYAPVSGELVVVHTGNETGLFVVTYRLDGGQLGVETGYCVLGLAVAP